MGATGVVATAILSIKAVPKAEELLIKAYNQKGDALTTAEKIKASWIAYVPAAVTGLSTIACIFGANILSARNQASLMSAYALLDRTYKEYQDKANELFGEDAVEKLEHEIIRSKFTPDITPEGDKELFFDYQSRRFFESTMEDVARAEREFLDVFHEKGYASLNQYYDILGIPRVVYGFQLGWFDVENNDPYNCHELEFEYEEITVYGSLKCNIITTNMPASYDYIV
jgi:hypothetical protein